MSAAVERSLTIESHRGELTAYCRRMLGSSFEAEDAVQETLLRAWRASGCFEGRASLRSWLYRIATNVCFDARRTAARRPVPVEDLPEPAEPGGEPDPSELALSRERLRLAVAAAVGGLPARQRAVLLLRDVLAWRAAEVAELLETTSVSVNSALQRARSSLDAIDLDGLEEAGDGSEREVVGRYLAAFADDDVESLVSLARAL
ncbi:MAG: sigma-70 family RNA polymerase sigma factor [Solirubrobacterales bacterium]|nr:sigma-70 family RNA polymerase sigma factor [Solirubrobacterales bacterium]